MLNGSQAKPTRGAKSSVGWLETLLPYGEFWLAMITPGSAVLGVTRLPVAEIAGACERK